MDEGAKLLEKYSGPFRLWFGHRLMIIITDPDHVKVHWRSVNWQTSMRHFHRDNNDFQTILHSPHTVDRGLVYSFIRPWLGMGLLTSEGGLKICIFFISLMCSCVCGCFYYIDSILNIEKRWKNIENIEEIEIIKERITVECFEHHRRSEHVAYSSETDSADVQLESTGNIRRDIRPAGDSDDETDGERIGCRWIRCTSLLSALFYRHFMWWAKFESVIDKSVGRSWLSELYRVCSMVAATVMGFKFECQEDYSRMADAVCRYEN